MDVVIAVLAQNLRAILTLLRSTPHNSAFKPLK